MLSTIIRQSEAAGKLTEGRRLLQLLLCKLALRVEQDFAQVHPGLDKRAL